MNDFDIILTHVRQRISLTPAEEKLFTDCLTISKIRKRQFIIQPGFTAQHRNYVLEGCLRSYVTDEEGQEHTIQFAVEDWWISDYNSYIYQQPATMFVIALEDSVVVKIDYETEQRLKSSSHTFETFFRIMAERSTAYMQRRIINNLTQTAQERYDSFLARYPQIATRVPQYALASFLGMSTEFLSKIRNRKAAQKS